MIQTNKLEKELWIDIISESNWHILEHVHRHIYVKNLDHFEILLVELYDSC